jgi:ParB family chromosome partitioning protein
MTQSKRGLGRGLDALLGPGSPPPAVSAETTSGAPGSLPQSGVRELDIDLIAPNPEQPRTHFEPEKLRELADSIREHGIIQPLVVGREPGGGYRLIAGERRLQAARLAGLQTVPVVFRDAESGHLLELALIENIQRADLNPIEEALAYRRLTNEYGMTQEEAARRVGKSRAAIANAMRLLSLEPEIRRSLVSGELSEGHARALLGVPEGRTRLAAWQEVLRRKLSVRETEAFIRRLLAGNDGTGDDGAPPPKAAPALRAGPLKDIETNLRRALSTRVTVSPEKDGARIVIDCYSREEFEHVVARLLGDREEDE